MQKKSSYSSKDSRSGPKKPFKKDFKGADGDKDRKPFKKSDDRGGSSPSGSSRPYSGRATDSDRPKRSFDKSGDKDRKPFKRNDDRGGSSAAGSSRPYSGRTTDSDRPKRSFDKTGDKSDRPYKSREGSDNDRPRSSKPYEDRRGDNDRPKRSFDKSDRPYKSREGSDSDRPKRSFDKTGDKPDRPYKSREGSDSDRPRSSKPYEDRRGDNDRPKRSFDKSGDKPDRPYKSREGSDNDRPRSSKPYEDRRSAGKGEDKGERAPRKSYDKPSFNKTDRPDRKFAKPFRKDKDGDDKQSNDGAKPFKDTRPFRDRPKPRPEARPKSNIDGDDETEDNETGEEQPVRKAVRAKTKPTAAELPVTPKGRKKTFKKGEDEDTEDEEDDSKDGKKKGLRKAEPEIMPLNKFIAYCGECSRRDAAELVKQGKVKVNDEVILDPGHKVSRDDKVTMGSKKLTPQKGLVYILLNKPKGFITTNDDPQGRKTVMDLVANAGVDRLFPVGRLDRNTSGLLLITNDGELTQKLSHPSFGMKKVYHVTLDRPLTKADFEKVVAGVTLDDGIAHVDALAYLDKKNELGLEIHSGRNRIVRRIFESMSYEVEKLDRVMYAGLTKKNLPRSKWRFLDEREIVLLKHFKV